MVSEFPADLWNNQKWQKSVKADKAKATPRTVLARSENSLQKIWSSSNSKNRYFKSSRYKRKGTFRRDTYHQGGMAEWIALRTCRREIECSDKSVKCEVLTKSCWE